MSKYWFKPKDYGWGFYPISWEGWLVTLGLVCLLMLSAWVNNLFNVETPPTGQDIGRFILDMTLIMLVSTPLMLKVTKGTVTWKWGGKEIRRK